jgi:hypothetical protein
MNRQRLLSALATSMLLAAPDALAQTSPSATTKNAPAAADPRPLDPTANLPSDTGAHSRTPAGAVTGAGHPQGRPLEHDVGAPGGLETRARQEALDAGATQTRGTGEVGAKLPQRSR